MKLLKKLYKLSSFILIYQLIVLPLASAEEAKKSFLSWDTVKQGLPGVLGGVNAFVSNYFQAQNQNQTNSQYDQYYNQFKQQYGIKPVAPQNIEGGIIFEGCFVLEARIDKPSAGLLCGAQPSATNLAGYAGAMAEVMEENMETVNNFLVEGNDEFNAQGIGCYNSKIKNLQTVLDQRLIDMDKRIQNLRQLLDNFKLQSRADLDSIKRATALLDGGPNPDEHIRDVKFENYLLGQSDAGNVCGSIVSDAELSTTARKTKNGGLRAIEELMLKKFSDTGSRRDAEKTPQEILAQAAQMRNEVGRLGNLLSQNMLKQGRSQVDPGLSDISYSGKILTKSNRALRNALGQFNAELRSSFKNLESETRIGRKIQGAPGLSSIFSDLKTQKIDLDEVDVQLKNIENDFKKSCLVQNVQRIHGGDITKFARSFRNPAISKSLNKKNDNAMANRLVNLLSDPEKNDIDEILSEIKTLQGKGTNSRLIMTTGKTVKVGERTITASTPLRPSQLLGVYVDNCKRNFKGRMRSNKSGYSMHGAIKAIKSYARQRKNLVQSAASNISNKMAEAVLTCPEDSTTGSGAMSCTGALNTNSDSFCLRTAQKCASNFKGCYEKTKAKVSAITKERQQRINNYQQNVARFKSQLNQELLAFNQFMELNARTMDAQLRLGTSFGVPDIRTKFSDIKRLPASAGVDPALALEDPEQYLEDTVENIQKIKDTIKRQNEDIRKKAGAIKTRLTSNLSAAKTDILSILENCSKAIANTNQGLQAAEEQKAESNNEIKAACQRLQAFGARPEGFEVESLADDLSKAVQLAAAIPGQAGDFARSNSSYDQAQIAKIRAFNSKCEIDAKGANPFLTETSGGLTPLNICNRDNRDAVQAMLPDVNMAKVCQEVKNIDSNTCEESKFLTKVTQELAGRSLCKKNNRLGLISKSGEVDEHCQALQNGAPVNEAKEELISDEQIVANADKVSELLGVCHLAKSDKTSLAVLRHLSSAYNCNLVKQKAGEIQVATCSFPVGGGVNQKGDPLLDLSGALGTAAGARRN